MGNIHKGATKKFDYTVITDRLSTISCCDSNHPTYECDSPGLQANLIPCNNRAFPSTHIYTSLYTKKNDKQLLKRKGRKDQ